MSMMYFPFDSQNSGTEEEPVYDREADSSVLATWMHAYFTDGVFPFSYDSQGAIASYGFEVSFVSGMNVRVAPGMAHIQGRFCKDTAYSNNIQIPAASSANPRIDTVALRLNLNQTARDISLVVIQGSPAANPSAPSLTRTQTVYDLGLANIRVGKGVTSLSAAVIEDTRGDSSRCGFVHVPVHTPDATTLYAQLRAEFNNWFDVIKDQLTEDAAGQLQTEIDELDDAYKAADTEINKTMQHTLSVKRLWVNASPRSAFGGTKKISKLLNISVDMLGQYQFVMIKYLYWGQKDTTNLEPFMYMGADEKNYKVPGNVGMAFGRVGDAISMVMFNGYSSSSNGRRIAITNSSGISFTACVYNNGMSDGKSPSYCIPLEIYGIKINGDETVISDDIGTSVTGQ